MPLISLAKKSCVEKYIVFENVNVKTMLFQESKLILPKDYKYKFV